MLRRYILRFPDESGTGDGSGSGTGGTSDGQSQADTSGGQAQPEENSQSGTGSKELSELRSEAAKYRTERNELQKKVEQLEGEKKTELEKALDGQKKTEEQLTEATQCLRNSMARAIAAEVGVTKDARSDVASLLNWDKVSDPDDEKQVEKAIRDLVKDKPYLLGSHRGKSDGGAGGERSGGKVDFNQQIRERAGRA